MISRHGPILHIATAYGCQYLPNAGVEPSGWGSDAGKDNEDDAHYVYGAVFILSAGLVLYWLSTIYYPLLNKPLFIGKWKKAATSK